VRSCGPSGPVRSAAPGLTTKRLLGTLPDECPRKRS